MLNGISIVVCCFNSGQRLPMTLSHLARQKVPYQFGWEVVVINNASTDNTVEVAHQEWRKLGEPCPLRVIDELSPGLSSARYRGVLESRFEAFIFCDDDNWLEQEYVYSAYLALTEHEDAAIVTGTSYAELEIDAPPWFIDYSGGYAVGRPALKSGYLDDYYSVVGAGMVSRRKLYLRAYYKYSSLLTDRVGNELVSGGDSEYALRVRIMGYRYYFEERLQLRHFISANRLTVDYRDRLFRSFRTSAGVLDFYRYQVLIRKMSMPTKGIVAIKAFLRFLLALSGAGTYDRKAEAIRIYGLTGLRLGALEPTIEVIRSFRLDAESNRL